MRAAKLILGLVGLIGLLSLIPRVEMTVAQGDMPGMSMNRAGRAEVRFLEGMMDHHQMALDMAQDCLAKATNDEVKTLCQNIIDAQTAEIAQMQGWLKDWYGVDYAPVSMSTMSDALGMGSSMCDMMTEDQIKQMNEMMGGKMSCSMMHDMMGRMGMGMMNGMGNMPDMDQMGYTDPPMMMGMMAGFGRMTGKDYDTGWLESMIDHHDDAVHMSERLLARLGTDGHQELKDLANKIITDQTAEIARMEDMITTLNAQ